MLSQYGKTKNIRHYQERAKNLLTNAIQLFSKLNLYEETFETEIVLGLCYFFEGAINESETILNQTALEFKDNQLHHLYLRACNNLLLVLHWKSEFQKALKIIKEIEVPVEFCNQDRIKYAFHTQAGLIYRGIKHYDTAIYHYNKAIAVGEQIKNWSAVSTNHNNLAFLYKNIRNFELAYFHNSVSIRIAKETNQFGWLPHFIDTKSLIYFAENKFELSLQTINEAISIFQSGEDYASLIDSMWNKVHCLLALNKTPDAILLFAQLTQTAQINIGEVAVEKYTKLFTDIIYIKKTDSLQDETVRFKRTEIVNALRKTDYNLDETAAELGYSTTNKLIKVLNNEFPEIYEEFGILPRTAQPKIKSVENIARKCDEKYNSSDPKLINQLHLRNVKLEFDSSLNIRTSNNIKTFYCVPEIMSKVFDISFDAVLAVAPFIQTNTAEFVLIRNLTKNDFSIVRSNYDKNLNISVLMDKENPVVIEENEILGKVIGYCSFEEADSDKLFFKSFQTV